MRYTTLITIMMLTCQLAAQDLVTVTTAPGNAMRTFYSLQNGVVDSRPMAEWDLAFEITGITGSIQANTAKGIQLYKAPYSIAQWSVLDTTGLAAGWPQQHNSETDWSSGAFNQGLTSNPFDLGWGIYNMITHNVVGDSCFVIKLANGQWKKLRIDGYASATDSYTWTWADLDGGNAQSNSLVRAQFAGRNFGYVSLESNSVFDGEPPANTWDLLFTRYMAFVPFPVPSMYPVAGVLQNRDIPVRRVNGVTPAYNDWSSGPFSDAINGIGFDWKTFNQQTFQWEYATDRVHFAQDRSGNIWKLVFTAYGGNATGDMTFTQEMVSATGIDAPASGVLAVWPNPVRDGHLNVLLDGQATTANMVLYDTGGRMVREQRLDGLAHGVAVSVDVSGLAPGIYVVRLQSDGHMHNARIVVE